MDYISNLPLRIIETILCLLPIQEAGRTSVLSKEWRYSWTKIPKLVFDEKTFQLSVDEDELTVPEQLFHRISETKDMPERCRLFYAIFQVLLCHDGTIQDFTLSMKADDSCFEIDQILRHLSRTNSVKKLKLELSSEYTLPSHFLSLTQLTYLYLRGCKIDLRPTFSGFGRLTTLFVEELKNNNTDEFLKLLLKSPLLKTVTLNIGLRDIDYNGDFTIIDLFNCLPVIEHLSLWYGFLQCFQPSVELPQLVHLKYFCIEQMCFIEDDHIHMLVPMITSFPNLEKLKLEIYHNLFEDPNLFEDDPRGLFTTENYSDIRFEHLREFDIINVSWRKDEMEFVKLILAKSPVLKKVRILLCNGVQIGQISETLALFPRASSVVEVTVGNGLIGFAQDQPPPPRQQQPSMREMCGEITRRMHHINFNMSQIGQQVTSMQTRSDAIFNRYQPTWDYMEQQRLEATQSQEQWSPYVPPPHYYPQPYPGYPHPVYHHEEEEDDDDDDDDDDDAIDD